MATMTINARRVVHYADDGHEYIGIIHLLLWYGPDAWDWAWRV